MKYTIIIIAIVVLLSGCATTQDVSECVTEHTCNFWHGIWHGFIAPFSFIGGLFSDDIALYAVNNNGSWYDFGFVLGAGILLGGSSSSSKR